MLLIAVVTGLSLLALGAVVGELHRRQPRPVRRHVGPPAPRGERRERERPAPRHCG